MVSTIRRRNIVVKFRNGWTAVDDDTTTYYLKTHISHCYNISVLRIRTTLHNLCNDLHTIYIFNLKNLWGEKYTFTYIFIHGDS